MILLCTELKIQKIMSLLLALHVAFKNKETANKESLKDLAKF